MAPLQPPPALYPPSLAISTAINTTICSYTHLCSFGNPSSYPDLTDFTTAFSQHAYHAFTHNQPPTSYLQLSVVLIIYVLMLLFIVFVGIILRYLPSFFTHEETLDDELIAPYSHEYKLNSSHPTPSKNDENETSFVIKNLRAKGLDGNLLTVEDDTVLKAFCDDKGYGTFSEKTKTLNMLMKRNETWVVTLE